MFSKKFQRKYALTDQGLKNTKKGAFWTVIVNLVVMGGVSILYLMMSGFMGTLTGGSPLPGVWLPIGLTVLFVLLSFLKIHSQSYKDWLCISRSICSQHPLRKAICFMREALRLQFAKPYHRNFTSAGFSASSVEKYHYRSDCHCRFGSKPNFRSGILARFQY